MGARLTTSKDRESEEKNVLRWAFGYDHAGCKLAHQLDHYLREAGYTVTHYGPANDSVSVDYVPFCIAAAKAVADGRADYGVVIGGSGQGEQMAANKVRGIRAALCNDIYFAKLARRDNDANVLALAGRIIAKEYAQVIIDVWIGTQFEGGRHERRIGMIDMYENGLLSLPEATVVNLQGGDR